MLFDVYGDNAVFQWLGWALVFIGLILANEFARRWKAGGIFCFIVLPACLTVYFVVVAVSAAMGAPWALANPTYTDMNSWFHYAKLYAATAGCIGFMVLKYQWGSLGKAHWFKCFPFVIVAINILIAVASDFESAIRAFGTTWVSTEGVLLHGGWHNVFNGIAGLMNIFVMTGWFGIYVSKKKQDMLWPDMTWVFIISYDIWNFCYTYNCLPTHSWYCGLALLLAPTVAGMIWNKGKPREHPGAVVHVLPGRAVFRQRLHLRRAKREQPGREPRHLDLGARGQHRGAGLRVLPQQEARPQPLHEGDLRRHQELRKRPCAP